MGLSLTQQCICAGHDTLVATSSCPWLADNKAAANDDFPLCNIYSFCTTLFCERVRQVDEHVMAPFGDRRPPTTLGRLFLDRPLNLNLLCTRLHYFRVLSFR